MIDEFTFSSCAIHQGKALQGDALDAAALCSALYIRSRAPGFCCFAAWSEAACDADRPSFTLTADALWSRDLPSTRA